MKKKLQELQTDVDAGELTATAWLWIIGGGLLGLVASCFKWTEKGTKPILARFDKMMEGKK